MKTTPNPVLRGTEKPISRPVRKEKPLDMRAVREAHGLLMAADRIVTKAHAIERKARAAMAREARRATGLRENDIVRWRIRKSHWQYAKVSQIQMHKPFNSRRYEIKIWGVTCDYAGHFKTNLQRRDPLPVELLELWYRPIPAIVVKRGAK